MKYIIVSSILICSSIILKKPVFYGLILSIIYIYISALIKGYNYKTLNNYLINGSLTAKKVIIILSLVGILTSAWMVCGTIPYLMYIGLNIVKNHNFIFLSFIIMSIISYILGTAVGSISTIGIALIGVGNNIGINLSLLAGAIVSGAFLGDRSSPISSCFNLTIEITNSNTANTIKKMNTTLVPSFIISSALYYILGMNYSKFDTTYINSSLNLISKTFNLNIFCFIPVIILFTSILLRLNIVTAITASIFSSFIICFIFQNVNLANIIKISIFGFNSSSMISGGGFLSMIKVLVTVISATAFTGLLRELNLLDDLINKFTKSIDSTYNLILKTGVLSIFINAITCNQTIGIIIPGTFMKNAFEKLKLKNDFLAHCISDTGNITAPLIPWNINCIVASTILGVPSLKFIPYTFLCYLIPINFILNYKINPPS